MQRMHTSLKAFALLGCSEAAWNHLGRLGFAPTDFPDTASSELSGDAGLSARVGTFVATLLGAALQYYSSRRKLGGLKFASGFSADRKSVV